MRVSIFTPSHKPDFLRDVWTCLQEQTYQDWEWVVVANGEQADNVSTTVEQLAEGDPRVRLVYSTESNVGGLKKVACEAATGDLFLEYDHDDLITHDCVEAVVAAARKCPKACFIYSDDVTCDWNHQSRTFTPDYGWQHYEWAYRGYIYKVNRPFPITARSLCEILYAPDHVRVWSRAAYQLTGGHNQEMRVGDDHELMVRTYLKGVHFEHIPRPLYIHRLKEDNTSITAVNEIQGLSWATRDKYLHELVKEWCRREKLPMYDLGGAHNCPHGFVPIDESLAAGQHPRGFKCSIPSPFLDNAIKDNSVGCFRAFDFMEHTAHQDVPTLLNFLYRKLVPGGWLLTHTPAVCDDEGRCGRGAYQDPTHKSFWSSNNVWYYSKRQFAKYIPEIKCRFQNVRLANHYPSDWHRTHLIPYLTWDACALKGDQYHPGPQEI